MTNVRHNQSYELSQVSEDLLKQTLTFISNGEKIYQLSIPQSANFQLTENEQSHMAEVKVLFQTAKKILAFSAILATLIFFTSQSKIKKELLIQFKKTIRFVIPALICLLVIILFAWNEIFTIFHQIFFPNGNWSFPADSLIIQLFPDSFWWGMAMGYVGLTFMTITVGYIFILASEFLLLTHVSSKSNPRTSLLEVKYADGKNTQQTEQPSTISRGVLRTVDLKSTFLFYWFSFLLLDIFLYHFIRYTPTAYC